MVRGQRGADLQERVRRWVWSSMETRALGRDGPQVPIICFGAWATAGGYGAIPEGQAIAAMQTAIDVGITFIDTAEGYGSSESLVGRAIRGRRDEVFLATKLSGDHSPDHLTRALENSLKVLGTDCIDLYQLHGPRPQWPIQQTMGHLLRLRDAGKIRYIGISNFSAEQTVEALEYGPIHSSQPRYSLLFRDSEQSVLPCCLENGIGVIPFTVLAKGLLTGRYRPGHRFLDDDQRSKLGIFTGDSFRRTFEVTERLKQWATDHGRDLLQLAIAWVLAHPAVTSAIVGGKSPEQVRHIVQAADWRLTTGDLEEIDGIQGDLRLHDMQWLDGRQ
jgi:aryl-alcohol dehydrogenase-like predicted oxidoreductase